MTENSKRPVFLNLARIHLPVTAVVSFLHRITGILLFLLIPALVYLLDYSLASEQQYNEVVDWFDNRAIRYGLLILIWGFAHHYFAGIRFLLLDLDIGIELASSRVGAWIVVVAGVVMLFLGAYLLL